MKIIAFLRIFQNKMIYLLFLCIFLLVIPVQSQLKIETYDEKEYTGYVTAETDKELTIRTKSGVVKNVPKTSITSYNIKKSLITTKDGKKFLYHIYKYDSSYIYYIQDYSVNGKMKQSNILNFDIADVSSIGYSSFGLTVGTPAALNIVYSYQSQSLLNFRIQGGIWGPANGIQANIGFNLSKSESFEHNLSICGGYSQLTDQKSFGDRIYEWTYTGVCYNFNWGGFFTELGLTVGEGNFSNPQLMLQLGYVYRFLD